MDEFYINKIINNKIVNNASIDLVIHDIKEFEYGGKTYLNIYVYCPEKPSYLKINDKEAINVNCVNDNVVCVCYEKKDVVDNMRITEYIKNNETIKVNDFIPVDYKIFDFNENSLKILRKMNLNGFKELFVVPKISEHFWLCSCGKINKSEEELCMHCGARLNFIKLYDTTEKIQRKYITEMFKKRKFSSENIAQELEDFRDELLTDDEIMIDERYLTKEDIAKLAKDSDEKVDNYKYRRKNLKLISKYMIIALITLIIIIIAIAVLKKIKNDKNVEDVIAKYCDNTSYKKVNNILQEKDCGTIIYYLHFNDSKNYDIEKMIDSGNEVLYKLYYQYRKENLHSSLGDDYEINNINYIKYLVDSKSSVSDKQLKNVYAKSLLELDKEKFTLITNLYANSKETWSYATDYFDYGIKIMPIEQSYEKKDYENIKKYTEYSLIYHKTTQDKNCRRADLYSKENIKYLISQKDNNACAYAVSNAMNSDATLLKNYKEAGGNMKYSGYLGDLLYELVYHSYYNEDEYKTFEEALKLLKNSGLNINKKLTSEQADPGFTPLDRFIDKNNSFCLDVKRGWSSAAGVKICDTYKKYYKLLKKNGAVCNKKCSYEKYFK